MTPTHNMTSRYFETVSIVGLVASILLIGLFLLIPLFRGNTSTRDCENGLVLGYAISSQAEVFDIKDGYQGMFGPYEKAYIIVKGESGQERFYEVSWKDGRSMPSQITTAWLCVTRETNPMRKSFY